MTTIEISEPLSPVDTAWLHMEDPTNLMMVTGVFCFERPIPFPVYRKLLEERLLRHERFLERVVEPGFLSTTPRWEKDPHFDIDAHLHHVALPPPHGDAELRELVSDLMSTPLDFTKPLWQFHFVEEYGKGCAVIGRLHHAIADGVALMNVLLSMSDEAEAVRAARPRKTAEPEAPSLWKTLVSLPGALLEPATHAFAKSMGDEEGGAREGEPAASPAPAGGLLTPLVDAVGTRVKRVEEAVESVVGTGLDAIRHPEKIVDAISRGLVGADAVGKLLTLRSEPRTAFKGPLGSAKRVAWSRGIAVDEVKAAGKLLHATVNDVLLTAAAGSLRRYLIARGEAVLDLDLRAVVPVNLRPPEDEPTFGNEFGLVFLPLPVGVEDPIDRLEVLKDRMDEIKQSPEAWLTYGLLDAVGRTPANVEQAVVNLFGARATAVMTNVPGPKERLTVAGVPITGLMFWVPQSGRLGLGLSILSYAGEVSIGVATDAGLVPDPQHIVDDFSAELKAILSLVGKERRAAARRKRPASSKKAARRRAAR